MKNQWTNKELAIKVLKEFPFFRRIQGDKLLQYLDKMELVEKKQSDIVYTEDCVVVMLNGRVILREH